MGVVRSGRRAAGKLLLGCAGSASLTGLAMLGMTVTTESRLLNYIFEPFLLLMLPGVIIAMCWSALLTHLSGHAPIPGENHDFTAARLVWYTFSFYCVSFCWLLYRRGRRNAPTASAASR